VLEHVPDDAAVRARIPSGCSSLPASPSSLVPAGMALWSDWDVALHHFRRYSRAQLKALSPGRNGKSCTRTTPTSPRIRPYGWSAGCARCAGAGAPESSSKARTEDRLPPAWLNACSGGFLSALALWRAPMPFGVSLILVARKRA